MMCVFSRFFTIVLIFCSLNAVASERREFYNGVRGLGMGDTSVATVNDETALILNPAGLGRLRNYFGTIIDPELDMGSQALSMRNTQAFSQPFTLDAIKQTLLDSVGTHYHARGQVSPSFVATNFGIGLLGKYVLDAEAKTANSIDAFYQDDLALLLGYNLRLFGGRIKIGFTGKVISRIEMNQTGLPDTQALDAGSLTSAGYMKEGVGIGADVGVLLTAPWDWLPTLGAVAHDVGGTTFDKASGVRGNASTDRPDSVKQDLDVGISVSPILSNNVRSVWTIEYRGVLTASDETDKAKLLHLGSEFNFGDVFFLRAGYNQRYWTGGFELASESFQFQAASYGEEIGTDTAPREDRRYVLKVSFRF